MKNPKPKTLKALLSELAPMTGASSHVRFAFRGESTFLSAIGPSSYFFCEAPFKIEGNTDEVEDFQVPLQALQAAVTTESQAKPATVSVTESTLSIKTGRAQIELATEQATEVLTEPPKPDGLLGSFVITKELQTFMKEVLPILGLEKIHEAQTDFRIYGAFEAETAFMAVYSTQQVVYLATQNAFGITGEFNVPYPALVDIMKAMPVGSKIGFAEDRIFARTDSMYLMTLVAPLSPKEPPGEVVRTTARNISKAHSEVGHLKIKTETMNEFLASCKGVVSDDSPVVFTVGDKVVLSVNTTSSRARMSVKAESCTLTTDFALELRLLKNIVTKAGDVVTLQYNEGVLLAKSGSLGLITTTHATK